MNSEVVLYFIIFIVFAVVQGIGQRSKQRGRPAPKPRPPGEGRREEGMGATDARSDSGGPGASRGAPASSEDMIPGDVWEEILGLARGEPRRPPTPQSPMEPPPGEEEIRVHRPPGSAEEIPSFEARSMEDLEPRREPDRSGPAKGIDWGAKDQAARDRAARSRAKRDQAKRDRARRDQAVGAASEGAIGPGADAGGRGLGKGARKGRAVEAPGPPGIPQLNLKEELVGAGTPAELRKAVVLKELLDPPVALRE